MQAWIYRPSFTGNVPNYDVIAVDINNQVIQIQVKAINSGTWQLNAKNYLDIEITEKKSHLLKLLGLPPFLVKEPRARANSY